VTSIACDLLNAPDPMVLLRQLDREGRLRGVGEIRRSGQVLAVMVDARERQAISIYLDPSTGVPVEIVQHVAQGVAHASPKLTVITAILDYQRLALTPQSERLLVMRPHPHARAFCAVVVKPRHRVSSSCLPRR
jgi:hypothetical protein